jgi:hypothetical protein
MADVVAAVKGGGEDIEGSESSSPYKDDVYPS